MDADIPTYCKECHSANSFEEIPERAIRGETTNRVYHKIYGCQICGHTTTGKRIKYEVVNSDG